VSWWGSRGGAVARTERYASATIVPPTIDRVTSIISRSSIKSSYSEHSRVCRELHLLFSGKWCEVDLLIIVHCFFIVLLGLLIMGFINSGALT
jgi:hypothetical protein